MGCKAEYDLDNWPPAYDELPDLCNADAVCADCMGRPSFVPAMCEECSLRLESMADYFYEGLGHGN
jgi:hypothetical protein